MSTASSLSKLQNAFPRVLRVPHEDMVQFEERHPLAANPLRLAHEALSSFSPGCAMMPSFTTWPGRIKEGPFSSPTHVFVTWRRAILAPIPVVRLTSNPYMLSGHSSCSSIHLEYSPPQRTKSREILHLRLLEELKSAPRRRYFGWQDPANLGKNG